MNLQLTIMTPPLYKRFGFFTTHKSKNSIYMKYHENSEKNPTTQVRKFFMQILNPHHFQSVMKSSIPVLEIVPVFENQCLTHLLV